VDENEGENRLSQRNDGKNQTMKKSKGIYRAFTVHSAAVTLGIAISCFVLNNNNQLQYL